MTRHSIIVTALAGALAGSCGGEILDSGAEPPDEAVGLVALAVTNAPADAGCLRIKAVGATTAVRSFGLKPGQSSTLMLGGLPTGRVVLTGEAFNSACGAVKEQSVASWVSPAVTVMLVPGQAAHVTLALTRPGQATVAVDFGGGQTVPIGGRCGGMGMCEVNAVCSNGFCTTPGGCVPGSCSAGTMCVMNRCRFPDGAPCMAADMCLGNFCNANRCASQPPEAPRPPGAPCMAPDQCQSRGCVMGRCQ